MKMTQHPTYLRFHPLYTPIPYMYSNTGNKSHENAIRKRLKYGWSHASPIVMYLSVRYRLEHALPRFGWRRRQRRRHWLCRPVVRHYCLFPRISFTFLFFHRGHHAHSDTASVSWTLSRNSGIRMADSVGRHTMTLLGLW